MSETLKIVNLPKSNVLNAQPILPVIELGASVMGSAGFGWSGEIDLRGGGDTDCIPPLFVITPLPKPEKSNLHTNHEYIVFYIYDSLKESIYLLFSS